MSGISKVLEMIYYRIRTYIGDLGEGLKKQGFALDWILLGNNNIHRR